jgi:glycosyltransferase involved in cell wall biosynthesis
VPHGKVGYVTEVNDASVAEAIVKFYLDTDIEKIRLNIRKQKLKFSWGSMCNTILELYKELS